MTSMGKRLHEKNIEQTILGIMKFNLYHIHRGMMQYLREKGGGLDPILFVTPVSATDGGNGDIEWIEVSALMDDRRAIEALKKAIADQPDIDSVTFISEAWISKIPRNSEHGKQITDAMEKGYEQKVETVERIMERLPPSERPDRREVLMYLYECGNGEILAAAEIFRDESGQQFYGSLEFMDEEEDLNGTPISN